VLYTPHRGLFPVYITHTESPREGLSRSHNLYMVSRAIFLMDLIHGAIFHCSCALLRSPSRRDREANPRQLWDVARPDVICPEGSLTRWMSRSQHLGMSILVFQVVPDHLETPSLSHQDSLGTWRTRPSGMHERALRQGVWSSLTPRRLRRKARGLPRALGTRSTTPLHLAFGSCPATDASQGSDARRQAPGLPMPGGSPATLPRHTPASNSARYSSDRVMSEA
jgi:hypothetical protein